MAMKIGFLGLGAMGHAMARRLLSAGHAVTVLERLDVPGGQARVAASVPSRAEFGDIVRNQVHECRTLGVDIRFGVDADVDAVLALAPDAVVVATGAAPERPYWVPPDATTVVDVRDVLEGRAHPDLDAVGKGAGFDVTAGDGFGLGR